MASYEDMFRVGTVSSVHPTKHKVRVKFDDKDGLVSNEIPVLARGSLKNKEQFLPDVGEMVLCAFLPNGEEEGFVIGSIYSDADLPLSQDGEEYLVKIPGAMCVSYHRTNHTIQMVDFYGSKMVWANGDITIKSSRNILLNPDGGVDIPVHISAQFD